MAPFNKTVLFRYWKYYFQPNAWLKIQSVAAMEIKNRPSPTGEPQLNHEPQERQCLRDCSYQFICCSYETKATMVTGLINLLSITD